MDLERHGTAHPFQITVDDLEGVKVLESFGDLQQLERLVRERTVYQVEANTPVQISRHWDYTSDTA